MMLDVVEPETAFDLDYVQQCFLQLGFRVSACSTMQPRWGSFVLQPVDGCWQLHVSSPTSSTIKFASCSSVGRPLAVLNKTDFRCALPVLSDLLHDLSWGRFTACASTIRVHAATFPGVLFSMDQYEIANITEPDSERSWVDSLDTLRDVLEHDFRFCLDRAGMSDAHMYSDPFPFVHVWANGEWGSIDLMGSVEPYRVRVTATGRYGTQMLYRTATAPIEYRKNLRCAFEVMHRTIAWPSLAR